MSTFYREPRVLLKTLTSIFEQKVPFEFEVIVADDGASDKEQTARKICEQFPVKYIPIERDNVKRNPCVARNIAYRAATGSVIIAQSDEVVHVSPNVIETLVLELESKPKSFIIASVLGCGPDDNPWSVYTGRWYRDGNPKPYQSRHLPYFFLGALWRRDLYAVGGNDEEFVGYQGYDDDWFAKCLENGLGLKAVYVDSVVGHHLYHECHDTKEKYTLSKAFYRRKCEMAQQENVWRAAGGPWPYEESFASAYKSGGDWSGHESGSGEGSSMKATESIRVVLKNLIGLLGLKSILDIPCGDFHWMRWVDLGNVKYLGADIVREIVLQNQERFPNREFLYLNLLSEDLPTVDLILCRDCFGHMSFEDCNRALENIKRSKSKYLLMTTFWNHANMDGRTGPSWHSRSMTKSPFNLSLPMLTVDELCQEVYPTYADKSLGLWEVAKL
jgi:glycosyltransferase involved in cell wall biosynthesis